MYNNLDKPLTKLNKVIIQLNNPTPHLNQVLLHFHRKQKIIIVVQIQVIKITNHKAIKTLSQSQSLEKLITAKITLITSLLSQSQSLEKIIPTKIIANLLKW